MSRAATFGVLLLATTAPLSAQSAPDIPLTIGTEVQAQRPNEDLWVEGMIVGVGECLTVRFGDQPSSANGFTTTSFRGVSALRVGSASQGWTVASADQLARLQACSIGGANVAAPTASSECGSDPSVARSAVLGMLYGLKARETENPTWDPYLALDQAAIMPITTGADCSRIVAALAAERARQGAAPDTLPLRGVLDLGGIGYVVSRGVGPTGPSGRLTISTALLSRTLELKSYQSFTY